MSKKILTFCIAVLTLVLPAAAKKEKAPVNYSEWSASCQQPSAQNGYNMYYPQTEQGTGRAIIRGTVPVKGMDARKAFLAAMIYAMDNLDQTDEKDPERFDGMDPSKNEFSVLLRTTTGEGGMKTTYNRRITVRGKQNCLEFETSDMSVKYREVALIPRTVKLEAMHPDTNVKQARMVTDMIALNKSYLEKMADYAAKRHDIVAPMIDKVAGGRVLKGMNRDEVKLSIGTPSDIRKTSEKERWTYPDNTVVIFENDKVSRTF